MESLLRDYFEEEKEKEEGRLSHTRRGPGRRDGGGGTLRETRTIGKSFFATADRL